MNQIHTVQEYLPALVPDQKDCIFFDKNVAFYLLDYNFKAYLILLHSFVRHSICPKSLYIDNFMQC